MQRYVINAACCPSRNYYIQPNRILVSVASVTFVRFFFLSVSRKPAGNILGIVSFVKGKFEYFRYIRIFFLIRRFSLELTVEEILLIFSWRYLEFEKELEAHIWWFCSTIKYFKTCEYELLTPSELGGRY